jgi:hypothetical protein
LKPFASQTYYELLEISVSASTAEVRSAWERLNRMYADDQLALYGLASAATAAALRKRLHEAMEVLTDDELRGMYDEEIGLPARELAVDEPIVRQLEMGELLRGADHSVASTHPRVAFTWSESAAPSVMPPMASPPMPPSSRSHTPPVPAPAPNVGSPPTPPAPAPSGPAAVAVPSAPMVVPPPSAPAFVPPPSAPAAVPPPWAPAFVPAPSAPGFPAPSAPTAVAPQASEAERLSEESAISMLPRPSPSARPSSPPPGPSAPDRPRPLDIPADAEFNGELLRKVRTSLGLSLSVVAERTRIGSKHLENVEADRYDALPATVYLRGILMSLAKELRLDGLKVSRSYLSLVERIRSKG